MPFCAPLCTCRAPRKPSLGLSGRCAASFGNLTPCPSRVCIRFRRINVLATLRSSAPCSAKPATQGEEGSLRSTSCVPCVLGVVGRQRRARLPGRRYLQPYPWPSPLLSLRPRRSRRLILSAVPGRQRLDHTRSGGGVCPVWALPSRLGASVPLGRQSPEKTHPARHGRLRNSDWGLRIRDCSPAVRSPAHAGRMVSARVPSPRPGVMQHQQSVTWGRTPAPRAAHRATRSPPSWRADRSNPTPSPSGLSVGRTTALSQ